MTTIDTKGVPVFESESSEEDFLFSGDLGPSALLARTDPAFQSAAVGGLTIGAAAKLLGLSIGAATGLGLLTVFLVGGAIAEERNREPKASAGKPT